MQLSLLLLMTGVCSRPLLAYNYRNVASNIINKQTRQTRHSIFCSYQSPIRDRRNGRGRTS